MIEMDSWKDCFINNEFYIKYVELVSLNQNTKKSFATQRHHIIPCCFFKYKKLETDNSANNIVNLRLSDHLLAHYYLSKCTTGKYKYAMQSALRFQSKNHDYEEIVHLIPTWEAEYEAYNKAISEKMMGHPMPDHVKERLRIANIGRVPHNKGVPMSKEQKEKLSLAKKGKKRKPHTAETKKKISEAQKGKVIKEETRRKLSELNKGNKISDATRKKIGAKSAEKRWYTDGTRNIYIHKDLEPPAGYRRGKTNKPRVITEEEHKRLSDAAKRREAKRKLKKQQDSTKESCINN